MGISPTRLRKHRKKMERMYTDVATISRYGSYEDPESGETRYGLNPVYEAHPCRISQKALGVNAQSETINQIAYDTKLIIAPELEILQGDTITVTRGSTIRTYTAGEPFLYPTHQEISIQRKDKA